MASKITTYHFHKKQSVFTLTAIQVAGATSLPVLSSSIKLFHQYGFATALWILFLGNLLIWISAFVIIQMTANTTKNTLDNVRDYLGRIGGWSVGIVILISVTAYYVAQTNMATEMLISLLPFKEGYNINKFFQFGVVLGIASVLAIIQGIRGLRWLSTISFPIIIAAFLGLVLALPSQNSVAISVPSPFSGLIIGLGIGLAITVDYPTFFQHSRSKQSSLRAVTAIQAITFLIGVGGIYLGKYIDATDNLSGWYALINGTFVTKVLFVCLVVLSCLCVNALNVYSASIAWELLAPNFLLGRKEYTIIGLALTAVFILTTGIVSVDLLRTISDVALANLCIVLISGYCLRKLMAVIPLKLDQVVFFLAWLIGSVITVSAGLNDHTNNYLAGSGFVFSFTVVALMLCTRKLFSKASAL